MSAPQRVCLITPGHLASAPRLIKEADALAEAGYRVHVVSGRYFAPAEPLDETLLGGAVWEHTGVRFHRGIPGMARNALRQLARRLAAHGGSLRIAAYAHHAESLHLGAAAARVPADLYVGHCLGGLFAAAHAAAARGVGYGFDIEDFHDAETQSAVDDRAERAARKVLQKRLLQGCRHLTAASPLIAERYVADYGVSPQVVLNASPLGEAPPGPLDPGAPGAQRPARLYWFSQTIGPGRGLEAVLEILSRMRTPGELHLRGFVSDEYRTHLLGLAARLGVPAALRLLPPAAPREMVRLCADADCGLSTEESSPLNRDLCLTNKLFAYLLAGIPQLLSGTAAQRAIAPRLGEAALLVDVRQAGESARALDALLLDPERRRAARMHAWKLGREQFCWELEKPKLLASIRHALERGAAA